MEEEIKKYAHMENAPYANFGPRLLAQLIDGVVYSLIALVIFFFVAGLCKVMTGQSYIQLVQAYANKSGTQILPYLLLNCGLNIIASMAYYAGFVASKHMATPGKMAMGIVIVGLDGQKISLGRAIARAVFYQAGAYFIAFFLPAKGLLTFFFYVGGNLHMLIDNRRRGLHDIVCGTYVIHKFHVKRDDKYEKFFDDTAN